MTTHSVQRRYPESQHGVALISVLLIVALVVALTYQLMTRQALVIAKTQQLLSSDQALSYALGGEAYARQILFEDWNNPTSRSVDTLNEGWAVPMQPFEVENGFLELYIIDLNSRLNLNSLAGSKAAQNLARLKLLLRNSGLDENLADAWKDWVDEDQEITGFGAEDSSYLLSELPYRTANQIAVDPSELMLVKGVTPEVMDSLRDSVCALPETSLRINVNTASSSVLGAITPTLSPAKAQSLIESPREFPDLAAVTREVPELGQSTEVLSVNSEYFEIHIRAEVNDTWAELTSVLFRNPENGRMTVIQRSFGKRFQSRFSPTAEDS